MTGAQMLCAILGIAVIVAVVVAWAEYLRARTLAREVDLANFRMRQETERYRIIINITGGRDVGR